MKPRSMVRICGLVAFVGLTLAALPAHAGGLRVSIGFGLPIPVIVAPAPVVVVPQPVYVQPAPVVVARPPVVVTPPPVVVVEPPVVYAPTYYRSAVRHWKHHHDDEDDD